MLEEHYCGVCRWMCRHWNTRIRQSICRYMCLSCSKYGCVCVHSYMCVLPCLVRSGEKMMGEKEMSFDWNRCGLQSWQAFNSFFSLQRRNNDKHVDHEWKYFRLPMIEIDKIAIELYGTRMRNLNSTETEIIDGRKVKYQTVDPR